MGCTPAYVALIVESLTAAVSSEGLDHDLTHQLVVDTFASTAALLRDASPQQVRNAVASPGGSTEAGLDALEAGRGSRGLCRRGQGLLGPDARMSVLAAVNRGDIADYVAALIDVYTILIILNVLLSWIQQFRPLPYNLALRAVIGFIEDTTNPYLNLFRSFIPRLGMFDISPIVAILVLVIGGGLVVDLIRG